MNKARVHYLSLASVISAFAVIMLHTNGCFWWFSTEKYWFTANIIECVMFFAVPVFFMISGATLIDYRKRYTTKEYFKKRVFKTFIPFLIWSAIGIIYMCLKGAMTVTFDLAGLKNIILSILNVNVISIYWFFVPLFGIYLCIPLFSAIKEELREQVFTFLVVVSFILNYLMPFVCNVFQIGLVKYIPFEIASNYLFYVLIGYLLAKKEIPVKWRIISYVLSIAGLLMHICGTYVLSMEVGAIMNTYKGYTNVPCALYSVGVFILIKQLGQKITNEKVISVIEFLSKYTFPVYLMHWFVMDILEYVLHINALSILWRVGGPVVIFVICIGITWIVRKLPIVKKILP